MKNRFLRKIRPIVSVIAVLATAALLVAAIVFSGMGTEWAIFLTGVLVAATLSLASRAAQAELGLALRNARLKRAQDRLVHEQQLRREAESRLDQGRIGLELVEALPGIRVLLVGRGGEARLYNRALREWLGLGSSQVEGKKMRELLGDRLCDQLAEPIHQALGGTVGERTVILSSLEAGEQPATVRLLPHRSTAGPIDGVFILFIPGQARPADAAMAAGIESDPDADADAKEEQSMFVEAFSEEVTGSEAAVARIMRAIEQNEFRLYCQRIAPLAEAPGQPPHYEILIRLIEEEEGMMAPGAFFPLVEKFGLMPQLDRWVVEHASAWAVRRRETGQPVPVLFINLSACSLNDPDFPAFVGSVVERNRLAPGTLCFEVAQYDLAGNHAAAALFAKAVRRHGCRLAMSGFGRDGVSFEALGGFRADYLKIDGSIILDILRDPMDLARVAAITRVTRAIDVKTVAELVESDECTAKLRELKVDFAQGFGISRPCPLDEAA